MKRDLIGIYKKLFLAVTFMFAFAVSGFSQGVYAYPLHKQSKKQQQIDKQNCNNWAHNQVSAAPQQQQGKKRRGLKGGAIGAGAGAIIGGGTGAVIGGASGAALGHRKSKKQKQATQQQAYSNYKRAYSSCMRGKGYSVD